MGGLRFGPAFAGILYVLLVLSAALALWVQQFPGSLPDELAKASPWVFLGFVIAFSVYRLALVRAGRYLAFKAFFQIGAAILFFLLLLPRARPAYESLDELGQLMLDPNPKVRSLAVEVARYRPNGATYEPMLAKALSDQDAQVREQAHASLVKLNGADLGPPSDPAAVKAWRERFP